MKKLLLATIAMLTASIQLRAQSIEINATNFPDANFRDYLENELSYYDYGTYHYPGQDGYFTPEEIYAISRIHCPSRQIASLKGIELLTNLEDLDCSLNQLTELDLSSNKELVELVCDYNQLTVLNLSSNKELVELKCRFNQLTELNITMCEKLEILWCNYNMQLTQLDLSHNTQLLDLICSYCPLTSLDLSNNTQLEILECAYIGLTELDLSQNTLLSGLVCNNNNLHTLDLSQNTLLSELYCHDNHLRTLDLSQHTDLIDLNCDNQTSTEDVSVFNFSEIGIHLPSGGNPANFINVEMAGVGQTAGVRTDNGKQYLVLNQTPTADLDLYNKTVTYSYNTGCPSPSLANATMGNVVITTYPYVMYVNPVSKSIAGNYYSGTIVLDYDAVVPAETEAYAITGLEATQKQMVSNGNMHTFDQLTMVKIADAGQVIPANTPVYVRSDSQNGLFAFGRNLSGAMPVTVPAGNLLKGSATRAVTVTSYGALTLGPEKKTGEVGFWQNKATSIPAHRCYLDASILTNMSYGAKGAVFYFSDKNEPTGIGDALNENGTKANDAWYTLDGRRLQGKPTAKGVYIHQGRKEVVR